MDIVATHHIDSSEPDAWGRYEWRYEYDLYKFTDGDTSLIARSYKGESEAHFLRIEIVETHRMLNDTDLRMPLFLTSVEYLRNVGKTKLQWLSGHGNGGYEDVTLET